MIKIAILTGYGINCEEETAYGFELAGGRAEIVHINDVVEKIKNLKDFQILVFREDFLMEMTPDQEMRLPIELKIICGRRC